MWKGNNPIYGTYEPCLLTTSELGRSSKLSLSDVNYVFLSNVFAALLWGDCVFLQHYKNNLVKVFQWASQQPLWGKNKHSLKILITGWWFQILFMFTPIWGRFPFWQIFLQGVVQPPTRLASRSTLFFLLQIKGVGESWCSGPAKFSKLSHQLSLEQISGSRTRWRTAWVKMKYCFFGSEIRRFQTSWGW